MNVYALSEAQILVFALVLLRMTGFIFSSAIFSLPAVNTPLKVLFALILSMVVFPLVKIQPDVLKGLSTDIAFFAAREIVVGLILGFLTRIFFFAVSMTGEVLSISLGLSSAQLFNPAMGASGTAVEQFYVMIGSLFFLMINGHHMMVTALVQSFELIAVGGAALKTGPLAEIAVFGQELLVLTVKMSAPVLVSILISNIAMGILGRAIPQMNVLVTSFPVTILIGLAVMILCMPLLIGEMNGLVELTATKMFAVMRNL